MEKFQEEMKYIPDSVIEDAKIDDTNEWTELRKKYEEKTQQALEKESSSSTNINETLQTLVLEVTTLYLK